MLGLGPTAYTLGMRHAFDADHCCIDNTTRKLMAEGKRPVSVGFWFSLGHSTIVFGLVAVLAFGVRALAGQLESDSSLLQQLTGVVGTAVSGTFLYMIGIINLVVLVGIVKVFRRMRHGGYDESALEDQLNSRGFMNKILSGATKPVTRPWQMYPIGVLFGWASTRRPRSGSWCLPAGGGVRTAVVRDHDAADLVCRGDELAGHDRRLLHELRVRLGFSKPVRKIYYNITITALSVAVALIIGSIQLISIVTQKAGVTTGPLAAIANVNLDFVGYTIVGLFVLVWVIAVSVWKYGRIEEKWSATSRLI